MAEKEVTIYATTPCLSGKKNDDGSPLVLKVGDTLKLSASEAAKRVATNRFTTKEKFEEIKTQQAKVAKADSKK